MYSTAPSPSLTWTRPPTLRRFVNAAVSGDGFNGECSADTCPEMGVPGISYTAAHFDRDQHITIDALPEVDTTYQWTFENNNTSGWYYNNGAPATSIKQVVRAGTPTNYLEGKANVNGGVYLYLTDLPAHDQIGHLL